MVEMTHREELNKVQFISYFHITEFQEHGSYFQYRRFRNLATEDSELRSVELDKSYNYESLFPSEIGKLSLYIRDLCYVIGISIEYFHH